MADDDLRYEPPRHGYDWLTPLRPESCLVVGDVAAEARDAITAVAPDVRAAAPTRFARRLHRGTYAFAADGAWHVMIVADGRDPGEPESARSRYAEDGHLSFARDVFEDSWDNAHPFAGSPKFVVGGMVRPKGGDSVGRVKRILTVPGGHQYEVEIHGEVRSYDEESLVPVAGDPRDPEFWLSQSPANAADISLTLTWTKLRHPLTDVLYSFASSKTVFRPYQFKPVLKMLTGSSGRLLIADEVGLGKTIEAGLIWSELEQRSRLDRILVVSPAALTLKWKSEMERRFDRSLQVLKPRDLADFADGLAAGREPTVQGVVSLESLRSADKVLDQLTELHPRFDLVIVDEAHYLRNRESKAHALGRLLAVWADYLVFLSATPLNLGNDDLFNLMNLLDEGHFGDRAIFDAQLTPNRILNDVARSLAGEERKTPRKLVARLDDLVNLKFGSTVTDRPDYRLLRDLLDVERPLSHEEIARSRRLLADLNILGGVLTRTRKAEVPDRKAVREPHSIDVAWTREEKNYYDAVYAWCMRRALENGTPPGFAMQMPLRQAASCIPASQALIRQRNPYLFQESFDDFDEETEADLSDLPEIPTLAKPIPVDTKYDQLLAELLRIREAGLRQMMIFSFFRGTLAYLASRLCEHFSVAVMDGSVPLPDREKIMRDFRAGEFEVLLLSEVGSEGLDFEFCNVLVNYDLPWNPMRVEQRIGRLDRFGQEHEKIFVYNMHVPGTIETDIFQRLYDRIGVFESSIGELEPILRDEIGDIPKRLLDPKLNAAGLQREMDRIAVALEQRRHDTDELQNSRAYLSGLDNLLIEGLTATGPDNGRFIGPTEIRRMLDELFQRLGGRRGEPDRDGVFQIFGSPALASRLRQNRTHDDGSRHSRSKLASLLQDGSRLDCTFQPEVASKHNIELLSGRHPLVKLALEVLADETLALPRFGSVSVPGLPAGRRYLVTIDLAETTGLRPLAELWATAVDVDTQRMHSEVGDALLTALAEGTLGDGPPNPPAALTRALRQAREQAFLRQRETRQIRAQENAALVEGRILAKESSLDLRISKIKEVIERLTASGQSASIIRLNKGQLRRLQAERAGVRDSLIGHKESSLSLTPVAIVIASSAEPTPC